MDLHALESGLGCLDPYHFAVRINIDSAISDPEFPQFSKALLYSFRYPLVEGHSALVANQSGSRQLMLASLFTLYAHEARHFHDLISTPFGAVLIRQYTTAALRWLDIQEELKKIGSAVVPLRDWLTAPNVFARRFPGLPAPTKTLEALTIDVESIRQKLLLFGRGVGYPGILPEVSARSILEASAVTIQEAAVRTHFGDELADKFSAAVHSHQTPTSYTATQDLILRTFGRPVHDSVLLLLCLVALCGPFQNKQGAARYPRDVLMSFLAWASDRPSPFIGKVSLATIWNMANEFFKKFLGSTIAGMYDASRDANGRMLKWLKKEVELRTSFSAPRAEAARDILKLFEDYCSLHETFGKTVLNNPRWYSATGFYLEDQHALPPPVVYIETEKGLLYDPFYDERFNFPFLNLKPFTTEDYEVAFAGLPEETKRRLDVMSGSDSDDIKVVPVIHVLTYRERDGERHSKGMNSRHWHRVNDETSGLRLVLDGLQKGPGFFASIIAINHLNKEGVRVYSSQGEITNARRWAYLQD